MPSIIPLGATTCAPASAERDRLQREVRERRVVVDVAVGTSARRSGRDRCTRRSTGRRCAASPGAAVATASSARCTMPSSRHGERARRRPSCRACRRGSRAGMPELPRPCVHVSAMLVDRLAEHAGHRLRPRRARRGPDRRTAAGSSRRATSARLAHEPPHGGRAAQPARTLDQEIGRKEGRAFVGRRMPIPLEAEKLMRGGYDAAIEPSRAAARSTNGRGGASAFVHRRSVRSSASEARGLLRTTDELSVAIMAGRGRDRRRARRPRRGLEVEQDLAEWADPDTVASFFEPLRSRWYALPARRS